jgi:hypothetical protein
MRHEGDSAGDSARIVENTLPIISRIPGLLFID